MACSPWWRRRSGAAVVTAAVAGASAALVGCSSTPGTAHAAAASAHPASSSRSAAALSIVSPQRPIAEWGGAGGIFVTGISFSPDGRVLASVSATGSLSLWNVADRKLIQRIKACSPMPSGVAFSPDSREFAIACEKSIQIREVGAAEPLKTLAAKAESVAFSPNGRYLASASTDLDSTVQIWDAASFRQVAHLQVPDAQDLAFSPNSQVLAIGVAAVTRDYGLLWTFAGSDTPLQLGADDGLLGVYSVVFTPDGQKLATGEWDHTVRVWDVASGRQLARYADPAPVSSVAISPDGRILAAADSYSVTLWSLAGGGPAQVIGEKQGADSPSQLAFSPDGRTLATGSGNDGTVQLWQIQGSS